MVKFTVIFVCSLFLLGCNNNSGNTGQQQTGDGQTTQTQSTGSEAESQRLEWIKTLSIEDRNEVLKSAHQRFFDLPYPNDYISGQIMPEVRRNRLEVAPDFPERPASGDPVVPINQWLENHPDQLAAYLIFLETEYQKYWEQADQ